MHHIQYIITWPLLYMMIIKNIKLVSDFLEKLLEMTNKQSINSNLELLVKAVQI